ncbi:pyrophosphatase PpaX [Viridibacillus sp. YIM B01967]|uniref:Pyrophosphatase PpaX n=1 Tax=Viridibacillus soli TaxID=2798301 RepID=A0ABS1H997_9BACL|nr:pyrophosphatase PpaX [Viridibacillus soli]MBK3495992.1 pyrophosphatase PpaX [Viridibacillus soli]
MTTRKIKALLFDFDGTLLDTNELIIQTFLRVLDTKFPGKYSREDVLPFLGPSLKETFSIVDLEHVDELVQDYRKWNIAHHDELVTEFDGILETLHALKAAGIRLAIVSTKRQDMLAKGIRVLKAEGMFEVIIGLDDVKNVKPDPEPILLALQKMGLQKDEVIMIGDNSHDIEGGQNAGVKTAGVAWSVKGEAFLEQFKPDYMLQHLSDLLAIVEEADHEKN